MPCHPPPHCGALKLWLTRGLKPCGLELQTRHQLNVNSCVAFCPHPQALCLLQPWALAHGNTGNMRPNHAEAERANWAIGTGQVARFGCGGLPVLGLAWRVWQPIPVGWS
eukprot:4773336-Amphidinium_carterae.1